MEAATQRFSTRARFKPFFTYFIKMDPAAKRAPHKAPTELMFEAFYMCYKRNKPILKREANNETFCTIMRLYY